MSFFGRGFWRREREPEPEPELTKTERYTQREFADAIAFAEEEWKKFLAYLRHLDPGMVERHSLQGRLNVFEGPVSYELETRFPRITEVAEDMRRRVGSTNGKVLLIGAIVKEALVRAGEDRGEVRKIIPT